MDIQVSSNFERALFLACGRDSAALRALMEDLRETGGFTIPQGALEGLRETYRSGRAGEDETLAMIATIHAETGEVICPHTAVGVKVAREHLRPGVPMVTLATAHPAKFPDAVERAIGRRPDLPARMAGLFDLPERITRVENDAEALKSLILERRTD
jgi:threonine synthase